MPETGNALKIRLARAGVDIYTLREVRTGESQAHNHSIGDDNDEDDSDVKETDLGDCGEHYEELFYSLTIPSRRAMWTWEAARSVFDKTGYWPVISDDLLGLLEFWELSAIESENLTTADIVRMSEDIDASDWLQIQYQENLSAYKIQEGDWPSNLKANLNGFDLLQTDKELAVLLCPTLEPWQVSAALRWGDSNDAIAPHYHTAVHKKWHTQFGAELVCANTSTIEMKISKPPETDEETMAIAKEHFAYCPDLVTQKGAPRTIFSFAPELYRCRHWAFWWD